MTESATDFHRVSAHSAVKYDLIGRLAGETQPTRATVAIGAALLPLCLLSGAFAWLRARRLDREIEAAKRVLAGE